MNRIPRILPALLVCAVSLRCGSDRAGPDAEPAGGDAPVAVDSAVPPDHAGHDAEASPPDAGPDAMESCSSYPFSAAALLAERLGFGEKTTGGDPNTIYRVTTLADGGPGSLRQALEAKSAYWIVFDVEGTIKLTKKIKLASDKTIDGRGRDVLVHGGFVIDPGTSNIIISDIAMTRPEEGDVISLRGIAAPAAGQYLTRDFWFHHLELYKGNDGLIDVRGATNITISWGHFHSHAKAFLDGSDTQDAPSPGTRITYHHNYIERITRRSPQFHYGLCDLFNNYQLEWYEFGAASQYGAQLLSEANIYEARPGSVCWTPCPDPNSPSGDADFVVSKKALVSGWSGPKGSIKSVADVLLDGAQVEQHQPEKVFSRSTFYSATPEPAGGALKAKILAGAGPRRSYCE